MHILTIFFIAGLACKIHRDDHDVSVQSSYKISKRAKSCEIEQMEKEEGVCIREHTHLFFNFHSP